MSGRQWPSDFEADEWTFVAAAGVASPMTGEACPTPAQLLASAANVLPPEPAARIAKHLGTCARCQELLATLEQIEPAPLAPDEEARIRSRIDVARQRKPSWSWQRLVAAPVAALALISVWLGLFPREITTAAVDPKPLRVSTGRSPAPALAFQKPAVVLSLSALTFRGASSEYPARLARALSAFSNNDYVPAAEQFDALVREYPGEFQPQFYLGVSRLLMEAPARAIEPLRRAQLLATSTLRADATWYLAHALYRSGDREEAADELTRLCGYGGPRSVEACGALLFVLSQRR